MRSQKEIEFWQNAVIKILGVFEDSDLEYFHRVVCLATSNLNAF
jgi:hypothetical protein